MERLRRIGILTFHWADNYGALLQAFALKTWLAGQGYDPFIVNYSPARLRGRDWLVPYVPYRSARAALLAAAMGFAGNALAGGEYPVRKRNMRRFREDFLTGGGRPVRTLRQLEGVDADAVIVGSDQVWNPAITLGLDPAYFGAFAGGRRTVAYAASLGGNPIPAADEAEFARLLDFVDAVSVREKSSAAYITGRFHREAVCAADPVFLPDARIWQEIEKRPAQDRYVLYYETELNEELRSDARALAQKRDLSVVSLAYRAARRRSGFHTVYSAGPREFLGYLRGADCVVTNSFHAAAFSAIFHKPFLLRGHRSNGARTAELLSDLGLEGRISSPGRAADMDGAIDWEETDRRISGLRRRSEEFLLGALGG